MAKERKKKQAGKNTIEGDEKYKAIFESLEDAVIYVDIFGKILDVNKGHENMLGFMKAETVGKHFSKLKTVRLKDIPAYLKLFKNILKGNLSAPNEISVKHKDGHIIPVELRINHVKRDGATTSLLIILRDITEKKKAEKEIQKLNKELEQRVIDRTAMLESANKELEAFSYSVSHDLRAPLRHIEGFSQLLQRAIPEKQDSKSSHYLGNIIEATEKMGSLIDDLLSFSRISKIEFKRSKVSLNNVLQKARKEIEPDIKNRHISWKISDLPEVKGDSSMLHHVFINLISNAIKFSNFKKKTFIEIGTIKDDGGQATIFVKDNGVGFNMKYKNKLFEVFQRLHSSSEFEGTGIGLAIVKRIIHRHGGRTWAEGRENKGATFYFSLPIN